jgi:hypothetical protein
MEAAMDNTKVIDIARNLFISVLLLSPLRGA